MNNLEGVAVACVVVPVKAADLFVSAKEALVYCQLLLLDKQQNNYELYVRLAHVFVKFNFRAWCQNWRDECVSLHPRVRF